MWKQGFFFKIKCMGGRGIHYNVREFLCATSYRGVRNTYQECYASDHPFYFVFSYVYWKHHVNRMLRNRLPRVMKHYSPTGRRNYGRPLKRLLDTWDRNGSTSGPTPWKTDISIYIYKQMDIFYGILAHTKQLDSEKIRLLFKVIFL